MNLSKAKLGLAALVTTVITSAPAMAVQDVTTDIATAQTTNTANMVAATGAVIAVAFIVFGIGKLLSVIGR